MTPRETELARALAACQQKLAAAEQLIALLRQKLDVLARRFFGQASEQLDPAQLELLLQLAGTAPATPAKPVVVAPEPPRPAPPRRTERTPRLPEHLPVIEEVIEPEPVQAEPEKWRCIGQEVSEQLDYEPGRFLRRRIIRKKYVSRTDWDQAPVIAPLPEKLQERGLAAPGLLAQVVVAKYCDHLPLYRQEQIYTRRHGVPLPRQTLARWVALVADWLQPIYQHIRTGVLAGGYVQVDETPIAYLEPGHGQTRQGYLWTGSRPQGDVFFHWATSRAAACLDALIPVDFRGTLQCDGYAAYPAFAAGRGDALTLAGCWAHVRRKFFEAAETGCRTAGWILRQIQHLYQIEACLRQQRAGPRLREAVRAHQSRPLLNRLEKVFRRLKAGGRHLPQSILGGAMDYALGLWPALAVFLTDGRVEIDNNLVENAIRPTAVGKKNWLFIGEAGAGEHSAIIYTVIESCRRRGLDPYAYLRDVLTRLPHMTNHQIPEVTPEAWARKRQPSSQQAAA
ncbi:MAG: IS66 family transposase [Terracidiphilus sp.]